MSHSQTPDFIPAMLKPGFYQHSVKRIELIETHISWVILTGEYVYKIKKPVNFGFLDFSSLEKRKFYCEEELRLNKRLAPELYLSVVPLTGSVGKPVLDGSGDAFEYVVKMRQFPQAYQLDHLLVNNRLLPEMINAIAELIAGFHQQITVAETNSDYGKPNQVYQPVAENFAQIRQQNNTGFSSELLNKIEAWSKKEFDRIKDILLQRKQQNFIRECHGDLHLRNLAWYQDKPLAFDCLEFNANFRWIDVISEIAFLIMDLDDHQLDKYGFQFVNRYLEITGDYQGCAVLRFYLVYRAMVRAKVDAIRINQPGTKQAEKQQAEADFKSYLELAIRYIKTPQPYMLITRGKSASGKSSITAPLSEHLGAIRIRSDVERKRLYNIKNGDDSSTAFGQGIYSSEATQRTYLKLLELADVIIKAGYAVIVDATFSRQQQREMFRALADKNNIPFIIMEFMASDNVLRQRIKNRVGDISDADINILQQQINTWQPLDKSEVQYKIEVNTEKPFNITNLVWLIKTKLNAFYYFKAGNER